MSDEADDEVVEPVTVAVRVDYYNEIMDAADLGFVAVVRRRDALRRLMDSMPSYPERDASKMKQGNPVLLVDDEIEISREDVSELWRRADAKVTRLADALNARFAPGVTPRYKG